MEERGKKRPDRRQVRTRRRIREAFSSLVMEKAIDKITIKELAERADIDRKTFYLHYAGVGEVLEEVQDELLDKVSHLLEDFDLFQKDFDALGFFHGLNDIIDQESDFYRRLLVADRYSFYYVKLKDSMKKVLGQRYLLRAHRGTVSRTKLELYAEYATSGVMALYVDWLRHPTYDLEEVAQAAADICYGGGKMVLEGLIGEESERKSFT